MCVRLMACDFTLCIGSCCSARKKRAITSSQSLVIISLNPNIVMKKNQLKSPKSARLVMQKAKRAKATMPHKEKPADDEQGLAAHDLFALFTADIIQENVTFTR
jgi:hypothetical protein